MINTGKLAGRTVFITGASRGIGKAIALKVAKDGANVVVAAKTADPHPKLPGTIYTACEEIEKAGGKGLPCIVDVRDELQVRKAVEDAVKKFGGIDIVINNASAISLTPTDSTNMKMYDLMHQINTRGTFLVSKECLPHLKNSSHAHILNLSPPLNMNPIWFKSHVAYTMAKYGMSMCVLGMHEEFRPYNIAVNALWPRTTIYTASVQMLMGSASAKNSRKPEIVADAAYAILIRDPKATTGNFFIDDSVLKESGVSNFDQYCCDPDYKNELIPDFFLEDAIPSSSENLTGQKPSSDSGKVARVFTAIESNLTADIVKNTQAIYQFVITGDKVEKWYVDLKNGNGSCGQGDAPDSPDATLTMDGTNFVDMFAGKLLPAAAAMGGKLKIDGNVQKALKLEKLMSSLKSKL